MDGNIYPNARIAPQYGLSTTVAGYATYTTLYDSKSPDASAAGGVLPANRGYFHARASAAALSATARMTLIEIRHFVNTTLIGIEEFGIVNSIQADGDGSDLRCIVGGYPIMPRGNRIVIAATSIAETSIDWVLRWGEYETSRITECGGRFAYDATGGNIAAGTTFSRCGIRRPMKSVAVSANVIITSGTAFNLAFQKLTAVRNTANGAWGTTAGGVLIAAVQRFPLAGLGADTAIDQEVPMDAFEMFNNAQLNAAGPDVGVVLWRCTTVHI